MSCLEEIRRGLEAAGQAHVLRFWSELSEGERGSFLRELALLDLEELRRHCEEAARSAAAATAPLQDRDPDPDPDPDMEPIPPRSIGSVRKSDSSALCEWENQGLLQIGQSRVGALLLAGGQGSRLGVSYPKGMYNVGLPSGKTLYQIQAERIRKIQELSERRHGSKCTVPWYIMTSEFTLAPTKKFFEENDYFGLDPANVVLFEQRMIPAVSFDGKIILQDKGKLAMAPDGNGGLYQALVDNHVMKDMEKRGVEYLHVYCVDNILIKMVDPIFIGFCVSKGADCGAKVVQKAHALEPVGVVCRVRGVSQVLEYSEIPAETAQLQGPDGELLYSAGNICNHFFTRTFLQDVAEKYKDQLQQHVAVKKVPFVDSNGHHIKPSRPNGIKMEKFVFDVFPFSRNFVAFEVEREDEFSPLKNAEGAASPSTARNSLLAQHRRWLLAAGATMINGDGNAEATTTSVPECGSLPPPALSPPQWEVSPLISYFGEGLEDILKGKMLPTPFVLDPVKANELISG